MAKSIKFHAVLLDECGSEFGADVTAPSRDAAYDGLRDSYPESRVVQLESPEDTQRREHDLYARVCAEIDGDEFGNYDDEDYL